MIATLPMYDWADVIPAHNNFWALIRDDLKAQGLDAPETLNREVGLWQAWNDPTLLLGQTCGMPYRTKLHGHVNLVATLDYGLTDAPAGYYYSELLIHADATGSFADFEHKTLGFNGHDSQSGWAAPQNDADLLGFKFTHTLHTGAHRDSALAVAEGRADIAAVDAVTWRLIRAYMPDVAAKVRSIGHTTPVPGLPLITSLSNDPAPIAKAVAQAIERLSPQDRAVLGIKGLANIDAESYLAVPTPPPPSQDAPQN